MRKSNKLLQTLASRTSLLRRQSFGMTLPKRESYHQTMMNNFSQNPMWEVVNEHFDDVVSRMKYLEKQFDTNVNLDNIDREPVIMRFDGFHFKSFTTGGEIFEKPFDANIHWALMLAARDLGLKNLNPTMMYLCSDELTLIFSGSTDPKTKQPNATSLYRGRVQKLVSISTSILTVLFNYYLRKLLLTNIDSFDRRLQRDLKNLENLSNNPAAYSSKKMLIAKRRELRQKLINGELVGHFDCRIYQLPSKNHAAEYIIWRQLDCLRNSKTTLGCRFFTQQQTKNLSATKIVELVEQQTGVSWVDFPNEYKYGTFIKKIKYLKNGFNPKTKETVEVERTSYFNQCIQLAHCSPEHVIELLSTPYWTHNVLEADSYSSPKKMSLSYPSGVEFTFGTTPDIFTRTHQFPIICKDSLTCPDSQEQQHFAAPTMACLMEMTDSGYVVDL